MKAHLQSHIEIIYDSVTNEDGWDCVIDTLVHDLNFRSGHLSIEAMDQSGIQYRYSSGISEEENLLLRDYFHKRDVWTEALSKRPAGKFHKSEDVVKTAEFMRTEFCNDYCKKIDLGHATGCFIDTDGQYGMRMGFHHSHNQGSIGDKIDYLNQLTPHLKRAAKLRHQLSLNQNHVSNITSILDKLRIAALIADEKGHIRYFNAQMETLLSRYLQIKISNNRLMVSNGQKTLNRYIHDAVQTAQGQSPCSDSNTFIVHNPEGTPVFEIQVEPILGFDQRFGIQYSKAFALIFINEVVSKHPLNTKVLTELFGLTRKELLLAEELVSGKSLAEISEQHNRSMNTLKTHLRSLFNKTNTSSQTKLVSRLLSSIAAVSPNE